MIGSSSIYHAYYTNMVLSRGGRSTQVLYLKYDLQKFLR